MTETRPPHRDQLLPAILAIEKVEDCPHDRTPLLIGFGASAHLFPGVFLRSKNGFVSIAGLFLRNRATEAASWMLPIRRRQTHRRHRPARILLRLPAAVSTSRREGSQHPLIKMAAHTFGRILIGPGAVRWEPPPMAKAIVITVFSCNRPPAPLQPDL